MIQEVGFENLPNSYIRMIEISKISPFSNRVSAHLVIKDVKKDGLFSWYKRDQLGKYLKLIVVASSNIEINSAIDRGELPLDRAKIIKHSAFNNKQVRITEMSVGRVRSQILDDGKMTTDGELFEFEYGQKFSVKITEKNLKIYCATFIDTAEYANDYRLDLVPSLISSYTGPVASESVFVNGEVVRSTFMFRTNKNGIWSGPVRFINGTYYAGSSGEPKLEDALERIMIPNMKIKDYRKDQIVRIQPSYIDDTLPAFPEPSYSYNPDGSLSSLFAIDLRALLLRRSKFAKKLAIVDEKLLNKVIQKTQLSKVIIKKIREGTRLKKIKTLVNTSDNAPYNLKPYKTNKARFEEMILSTNPNIRHFALRDYEDNRTRGRYYYTIEIEFQDPTKLYIDEIAKKVQNNLSLIKNYVARGESPKSQNKTKTRYTDTFVNRELSRQGIEKQPWNIAAQLFGTFYGMFMNLDDAKSKEMAGSSLSRIHPSFATPISSKVFMKEYSDIYTTFVKYFDSQTRKVSDIEGVSSKGKLSTKKKILVKNNYKETILHEERDNAIIYYNFKKDIYPTVSMKEMITRSQKEKTKFFKSKPSLEGTNLSKMSKEAAVKLAKDANNVIGFLTPEMIKAKKDSIDLSDPSSVDIEEFNKIYTKTIDKKESLNVKPRRMPKLNIKVAKKIDKYLQPVDKEAKSVEENLGKDSKFRFSEKTFRPTITSKISKKIQTKVKTKNKKQISSKQFRADSKNVKNLIKKIKDVRLPPSFISIVASESTSAKNNTLTSKTDLASNSKTKDFFALMYTNPVKIETIKGYIKDAKGRDIYSRPIWELLSEEDLETTNPIICKFTIFNTKMFETQNLEVNIANENFILLPNSLISKEFTIEDAVSIDYIIDTVESLENNELDYHTTNPIQQSEDKNGPLR